MSRQSQSHADLLTAYVRSSYHGRKVLVERMIDEAHLQPWYLEHRRRYPTPVPAPPPSWFRRIINFFKREIW